MSVEKSWGRSLLMVMIVAVAMGFSVEAAADQAEEEALNQVRQANDHYDQGAFDEALALYRQAYDHLGDERLLYRIGLSYENMGNYRRARQFLEKYLEEDDESPVRGRVEAAINQNRNLEESIQSYIDIDTEPAGAEIYLYGYMEEPEAVAPAKVPVGAGNTRIALVFPEGHRLEVIVDVGAGETVERLFQIGTGDVAIARDAEGEEVVSDEMAAVELPPGVDEVDEPPVDVPDEDVEEEHEERAEVDEDVIPAPEDEQARSIRLDRVNAAPPWWASTLGILGILGGQGLILTGILHDGVNPVLGGILGIGSIGGGIYLLGRNWRSRMPSIDEQSASVPTPDARPVETPSVMLRWTTRF